jgi:hypothetical protein
MKTNIPNDARETVNDIFSKYEKILRNGIAPRDVGGKRIKKQRRTRKSVKRIKKQRRGGGKKKKTTRKKKGAGNLLGTPLDCSDSSDSSDSTEFITPNNSSDDLIPESLKMHRTPPRKYVEELKKVFEDALSKKIIKEQPERSENINEYMDKIKEGQEEYRKAKAKGEYYNPNTFGGKKTRKRKHKKTKKRKPKKKTRRRK